MIYFLLAVIGVFSITTIVAIGVLGYAFQQMSSVASRATAALAQVKGLAPHVAAPETFAPGGRSWEAVERERIEVTSSAREASKARRAMELRDAIRIGGERGDDRVVMWRSELAQIEGA
jgi:hypothetical protein